MQTRIHLLRQIISENILPLINSDYILIDLPYYLNVGDVLIWDGTEQLLAVVPYHCLERASFQTFSFRRFPKDVVILMQGGGNFGDLYPWHSEFRCKIIETYPDNPIIILPQSVHYEQIKNAVHDADIMRKHQMLTICARDMASYEILKRFNFCTNIKLLPDMAFCMNINAMNAENTSNKTLLLLRNDQECPDHLDITKEIKESDVYIHDWFDQEQYGDIGIQMLTLLGKAKTAPDEVNKFAYNIFRPWMLNHGENLLSEYSKIYSTRLHAFILGIMLGKNVVRLDNKYSKIANFYSTWLTDDLPTDLNLIFPSPDISVIIPVYNVENYILECIQSVAAQDYDGCVECLIIDDCGQDSSMQIAQSFIDQSDSKISFRIIHHTNNRGLSASRNTGLLEARGNYVFFLDSDDIIPPYCLSRLMAEAGKYPQAQMIMGNVEKTGNEKGILTIAPEGLHEGDAMDMSCQFLIYTMAWNKLLSRNFIIDNELFFVEGLLHEDILWYIQVAYFLNCYSVVSDCTYYYRIRNNSITTTDSAEFHKQHMLQVCIHLYQFIFDHHIEGNQQLRQLVMSIALPLISSEDNKDKRNHLKNNYQLLHKALHQTPLRCIPWLDSTEKYLFKSFRLPSHLGYIYYRFFDLIRKSK